MNVHEELALDVFRSEAAEAREIVSVGDGQWQGLGHSLHLVEDDAAGLVDLEESDSGSEYGDDESDDVVGSWQQEDIVVIYTIRLVRVVALLGLWLGLFDGAGNDRYGDWRGLLLDRRTRAPASRRGRSRHDDGWRGLQQRIRYRSGVCRGVGSCGSSVDLGRQLKA